MPRKPTKEKIPVEINPAQIVGYWWKSENTKENYLFCDLMGNAKKGFLDNDKEICRYYFMANTIITDYSKIILLKQTLIKDSNLQISEGKVLHYNESILDIEVEQKQISLLDEIIEVLNNEKTKTKINQNKINTYQKLIHMMEGVKQSPWLAIDLINTGQALIDFGLDDLGKRIKRQYKIQAEEISSEDVIKREAFQFVEQMIKGDYRINEGWCLLSTKGKHLLVTEIQTVIKTATVTKISMFLDLFSFRMQYLMTLCWKISV